MAGDTRERMIEAAVSALRRDGAEGMSFTDVLRESGAARGAIYHHFPGGKSQLIAEATVGNGIEVRGLLAQLPAESPAAVARGFLTLIRPVVLESANGSGCAVAAAAMASSAGENDGLHGAALHDAAATAISSWISELAGRFEAAGLAAPDARDLAASLITILEGAHVLARATGGIDSFDEAARVFMTLIEHRYGAA